MYTFGRNLTAAMLQDPCTAGGCDSAATLLAVLTQEGKGGTGTATDGLKMFDAYEGQKNCAVTGTAPTKVCCPRQTAAMHPSASGPDV